MNNYLKSSRYGYNFSPNSVRKVGNKFKIHPLHFWADSSIPTWEIHVKQNRQTGVYPLIRSSWFLWQGGGGGGVRFSPDHVISLVLLSLPDSSLIFQKLPFGFGNVINSENFPKSHQAHMLITLFPNAPV
ncbi:hypothetical protein CDAR_42981 [Caerostris darwini]|uniref:Uncharacterized protein n=1 Tax=Caerostris darwini TaxID=1538125 RepID=A0AAV4WGG9_9ARAC|nr:hypothetical protein CDAR_42981 [Caerostris darwini]